jgi:S-adenosylmethionine synthetase
LYLFVFVDEFIQRSYYMPSHYLFTSESVGEGHPDKIADQISDAVLDSILTKDKYGRVACETILKTGLAFIFGEITTTCYVEMQDIVRKTIKRIGYENSEMGFDWRTCAVLNQIERQSPDIAQGVSRKGKFGQGAGDQGMMIGFATTEGPEFMPLPIQLAHALMRELAVLRRSGKFNFLRPDAKSQVTMSYENGKPVGVETVVVSTQHTPEMTQQKLKAILTEALINKVIPNHLRGKKMIIHVNPTGRFVIGGPQGDSGLTGRKIIVDTYGGAARHGGGAFSGKDPSKVDRSAAYYARYVAKNIVASGLAEKAEVQIAYAIGIAEPVSVMATTFGTGKIDDERLGKIVKRIFDFRPGAIIHNLKLLRPIYEKTAAYGHFGRNDPDFTWEHTDKVGQLRDAAGLIKPKGKIVRRAGP